MQAVSVMPTPYQISQRQLAKLAKVSPMTVSLALRGAPSISEKTRARIRALAMKYHYRPDPSLAALNAYRVRTMRTRHQGVLGWLTAFPTREGWREMIQSNGYFEGARAQADLLGYRLETFWISEPNVNAHRMTQILLTRSVRGVIVAPLPSNLTSIELSWEHFSAIVLGYSLHEPKLHVVMNNQFRNMQSVVLNLYRLGYRRIGLAMPSSKDARIGHNYLAGYWISYHDLPKDMTRLAPLMAPVFDKAHFRTWLRAQKPDAIVVAASTVPVVIDWLRELNLSVPRDIGLAVAAIPYENTTISGIDENVRSIGAQAVDAVVGMIHRNEIGIPAHRVSMLLDGVWQQGKTVRAPLGLGTSDSANKVS